MTNSINYSHKTKTLTAERLRELLDYNPETGVFTWRINRRGARGLKAGARAGNVRPDGYRCIRIDGTSHLAHRLAFLWVTGELPLTGVDHKNRTPGDDRFLNLRPANQSENLANRRQNKGRNLPKGVYRKGSGFRAVIGGRHLGSYHTEEAAYDAYTNAAHAAWGEFAEME
jgi:hypothetical protein